MNRLQLNKKIDVFLKHGRKSHGGWAEVTSEDIEQLDEIIGGLIDLKSQRDPDGDRTIEYALINRREGFWPVMPWATPYETRARYASWMLGDATVLLDKVASYLFVLEDKEKHGESEG